MTTAMTLHDGVFRVGKSSGRPTEDIVVVVFLALTGRGGDYFLCFRFDTHHGPLFGFFLFSRWVVGAFGAAWGSLRLEMKR